MQDVGQLLDDIVDEVKREPTPAETPAEGTPAETPAEGTPAEMPEEDSPEDERKQLAFVWFGRGFSKSAVARLLGVHRSTVGRWIADMLAEMRKTSADPATAYLEHRHHLESLRELALYEFRQIPLDGQFYDPKTKELVGTMSRVEANKAKGRWFNEVCGCQRSLFLLDAHVGVLPKEPDKLIVKRVGEKEPAPSQESIERAKERLLLTVASATQLP